jgi:hypothetical protein
MLFKAYGLEYRVESFVLRNIYLSVQLLTHYPPRLAQEERYSILNLPSKKDPSVQLESYLDGGGAPAQQRCYPRCAAACTAAAARRRFIESATTSESCG